MFLKTSGTKTREPVSPLKSAGAQVLSPSLSEAVSAAPFDPPVEYTDLEIQKSQEALETLEKLDSSGAKVHWKRRKSLEEKASLALGLARS